MGKKLLKVGFLFGAGCECSAPFSLPTGASFKRDTILAKDVKKLIKILNSDNDYVFNGHTFLSHNNTSILYQTLKENGVDFFELSPEQKKDVSKYLSLKQCDEDKDKTSQKDRDAIYDAFRKIFKSEFYDIISDVSYEIIEKSNVDKFLKEARFYSFVDSLFNCLREPERYKKEVSKVIKLYYSAFKSVLLGLIGKDEYLYENFVSNEDTVRNSRKKLQKIIETRENEIIKNARESKNESNDKTYYEVINDIKNHNDSLSIYVVTTNYTKFAEKIIGLKEHNIAYVHGKLDLFEDIVTKRVDYITEFDETDFIIPFIFVQSGIKPIVCGKQIKELAKAVDIIENSDILIILGYGINTDDEHITNFLRERARSNRNATIYFKHVSDKNALSYDLVTKIIEFSSVEDFENEMYKLLK